ncbi:hypothetical protein CAPTEDRAFT_210030 [Capitella teleta]|uniref:CARD domain-containing protein n=1 Tax=Capitella teleta TaxID=283909 RepID=R7VI86_CAPTE|nr:hypothetical protein CAPTEDRAFT_210030 [Capitella teleta]|eukprot:ELU18324.1 hypothetical protein CAPTEDRAFT_210030 [Capitella teleta]
MRPDDSPRSWWVNEDNSDRLVRRNQHDIRPRRMASSAAERPSARTTVSPDVSNENLSPATSPDLNNQSDATTHSPSSSLPGITTRSGLVLGSLLRVAFDERDMILSSQGKMALLSEQRKQILTDKRVELVGTIKLHGLWSHLRSRRIVTKKDEARIKLNKTSHEQIGELLDHLAKRTESDFEAFCECLEANNQGHVVTEILGDGASSPSNEDVREQLERCYSRLRNIATAPEWTQELALDSAVFYISLHLQKGETATT